MHLSTFDTKARAERPIAVNAMILIEGGKMRRTSGRTE